MSQTAFLGLCVACTFAWLCIAMATGAPSSPSPGQGSTDKNKVNDEDDSPPGRRVNVAFVVGMVLLILFLTAVLVSLACFTACYGRNQRAAAKQNASSESESAGNATSRKWNGESNYFVERDEEEVEPHRSQQNISPNTYSSFETSSNGQQDHRAKNTRTKHNHSLNNGRVKEQTNDDNPMTIERHPVNNTGVADPLEGRNDAATKENTVDDKTNDYFEVVSQLSGGHDRTDYDRQGELFLSRIAQNASETASDKQESTRNAQQRHLVDSPALIQRYLAQKEGTNDGYDADQPEATAWLPAVDRLQVHQDNGGNHVENRGAHEHNRGAHEHNRWAHEHNRGAHEHNSTHRHSRKHRARSDSVISGGQDRGSLRQLEPAPSVAPQPSSIGQDNPSSPAEELSSLHMDETAKSSLHRWASNDDLRGNVSQGAGSSDADDTAPVPADSTWDDQALATKFSFERQNNSSSEHADELQLHAQHIDVERVTNKSRLPPLSHVSHNHTSEHGSRKKKRHDRKSEHHPRSDDEAATNGSRRKKHRHRKHRRDGNDAKSESPQGYEAMSTRQDEHTDDVARSVNEDGDDNKKETCKHREKHRSKRLDNTADGTHSKHASKHFDRSSESAMKDLVISYKKSHREKALEHTEGDDV